MCENGYRKEITIKIFFFHGRSNIEHETKVIGICSFILFHGQNNERRLCMDMPIRTNIKVSTDHSKRTLKK